MAEYGFASHSMLRGCLLIIFAYIWLKAFKKKNRFFVIVKDNSQIGWVVWLISIFFTLQWEMGECYNVTPCQKA